MSEDGIRAVGAVVLVVMGALLVLDVLGADVDAATAALAAFALIAAFVLWAPARCGELLGKISSLNVGGVVEVAFKEQKEAQRVADRLPEIDEVEDDVPVRERPRTDHAVSDVLAVREMMQKRLRFIRDALLCSGADKQAFDDVVADLRQQDLIRPDEASVIFHLSGDSLPSWPEKSREQFLDSAWKLSVRFATHIWDRMVRTQLDEIEGVLVSGFDQPRTHRPDFQVTTASGEAFIAAARVAVSEASLDDVNARLTRESKALPIPRVVVVPKRKTDRSWVQEADFSWPEDSLYAAASLPALLTYLKRSASAGAREASGDGK